MIYIWNISAETTTFQMINCLRCDGNVCFTNHSYSFTINTYIKQTKWIDHIWGNKRVTFEAILFDQSSNESGGTLDAS